MLSFPAEQEQDPLVRSPESSFKHLHPERKILKKTILNGIGLFTQGYVSFVIAFGQLFSALEKHHENASQILTFVGHFVSILSPLIFGHWADLRGRKHPFTVTLAIIIIGAIFSVLSVDSSTSLMLFGMLAAAQIFIGVGTGGELPLATSVTAESFSISKRGRLMVVIIFCSVLGRLLGALFCYISVKPPQSDFKTAWRCVLIAGVIPGLIGAFLRSRRGETRRWVLHAQGHNKSILQLRPFLSRRFFGITIPAFVLGMIHAVHTLLLVFLLDNVFHFKANGSHHLTESDLDTYFLAEVTLTLASLPGYLAAFFMVDLPYFGRKGSQGPSFFLLSLVYLVGGLCLKDIVTADGIFFTFLIVSLYVVSAAPSVTCFLIPVESFPTSIRARAVGFATAARYAGRLAASSGLNSLISTTDLIESSIILYVCSAGCLAAALATRFLTMETRNHSMDNLEMRIAKLIDDNSMSSIESFGNYVSPSKPSTISPKNRRGSSFVDETNQEYLEDSDEEIEEEYNNKNVSVQNQ